jgi:hypothetical protein
LQKINIFCETYVKEITRSFAKWDNE